MSGNNEAVEPTATELVVVEKARRVWTVEQKRAIVAESKRPGVIAADVAQRHGLDRSTLCHWARDLARLKPALKKPVKPTFLPIAVSNCTSAPSRGVIEVMLANGLRVRVAPDIETAALVRIVTALAGR